MKSSSWTLYGKIIKHIESLIENNKREFFQSEIKTSFNKNILPSISEFENKLKEFTREQTGLELSLRLDVIDPIQALKNLRPVIKESDQEYEFDIEDAGSGTQSAISISIGRAYSEIVRRSLLIAIEEPELFLHPHGKRNFYKKLLDLSRSGIQIFYTTHDPLFIDLSEFNSINIVKKDSNCTTITSGIGKPYSDKEVLQRITKFSNEANEVFFSKLTILVEGYADKIACALALEKLGIDINIKNISIIDCNGISNIPAIAEILKYFRIKTIALVDADPGNVKTSSIITEIERIVGCSNLIKQDPNLETLLGESEKIKKEEAYDIVQNYLNTKQIPQIYHNLKTLIA